MTPARSRRRRVLQSVALGILIAVAPGIPPGSAAAVGPRGTAVSIHGESDSRAALADRGWRWPLDGFRIAEGYVQPEHTYGAGHRGIDLAPEDSPGVRATAAGVIAFAGPVAGRGILTIDHGDGLVTTFEPVTTELRPGDPVGRGDRVATLSVGGHTRHGELHFGVRLDGEYINPLLLLGGVPRAVLLPCC